jgi:transcriptional regulator with XRE-family HTH domain
MIETREKAGLTQHQLAQKLRKPQSFVAKYEGGERRVDVIEFMTIARAMGADAVSLLRALMRRVS